MAFGDVVEFDPIAYQSSVDQDDFDAHYFASNTVFNTPLASEAVGGWTDWLKPAGNFVTGLASTAGQILSSRDALIAKQEDNAFNRMLRSAQLDLAKYQVSTGSEIEKAKLAAQLALARAPQTSFFGVPIPAASSNLLLLAGLGLVGVMIYKRR